MPFTLIRLVLITALSLATVAIPRAQEAAVPARTEAPRKLLTDVLESRGGAARFARLLEIRRAGTLTIPTREGDQMIPVSLVIRPPGQVTMETGAGETLVRQVVGPGEAYRVSAGKRSPLAPEDARRLGRLGQVDEALLARSALDGGLVVQGVEEAGPGQLPAELASAAARGVRLKDAGGSQYVLVIPASGGLPTRVDYRSTGPDGVERDVSDFFRDWRVVDGLLFPFEVLMFQEERGFGLLRFDSIEIDLAPESTPRPS